MNVTGGGTDVAAAGDDTTPHLSRAARVVDTSVAVLLFGVQGLGLAVSFLSFIALPMSNDNCAYVDCGDEKWITWAMALIVVANVVAAVFSAGGVYLLARQRIAFWLPLLGCLAQVAIIAAAWWLAAKAGPIS
jgi:hypothetical protein